ncbi:unnamed protein product, partial [Larinioides sclopetarius]
MKKLTAIMVPQMVNISLLNYKFRAHLKRDFNLKAPSLITDFNKLTIEYKSYFTKTYFSLQQLNPFNLINSFLIF